MICRQLQQRQLPALIPQHRSNETRRQLSRTSRLQTHCPPHCRHRRSEASGLLAAAAAVAVRTAASRPSQLVGVRWSRLSARGARRSTPSNLLLVGLVPLSSATGIWRTLSNS
jgi:hypothetical protein